MYQPYYGYQQPPTMAQHLVPSNSLSPSSQGSESLAGTPAADQHSFQTPSTNGKRPASTLTNDPSRKKQRTDDSTPDGQSPTADKDDSKPKPTRGSRACTVCRRLKMKCVGAEQGPPCKRCIAGNHECIFEESNRGKRSSNPRKHELLTRSLRKMERTLDTVLKSIGNPSMASGMTSRSPSPSPCNTQHTQALIASPSSDDDAAGPSEHPPSYHQAAAASGSTPGGSGSAGGGGGGGGGVGKPHQSPKLHSLPDNALNPLGLLAEASLANRRAMGPTPLLQARASDPNELVLGVASDNYFRPGPMTILPLRRLYIERQIQPEMLSFVNTEEVVALFDIYFDNMNVCPHCSLLDRDLHTPSLICSRSPFLLTTICAIAARFYSAKPELYGQLMELAKKLAFSVPLKGYKSLEIVQAYLLLTLWGCGAVERYEYDKTWLLLGMATRMATDLNLHRKTAVASQDTEEGRARDREVHNRERTWYLCFALDRSISAQMGKPHSIKEDFVIRNISQWVDSPVGTLGDAPLAAYVELQRIVSRSLDFLYSGTNTPSGLQTDCDYLVVIKTIETQIQAWDHEWSVTRRGSFKDDAGIRYSRAMRHFYYNYYMLVINSFGLQNAIDRSAVDIGHFFVRCYGAATAVAVVARDILGPMGYLRYSPDSHFVFLSYAVLSLLKFIRPEFQTFIEGEQKIIDLVKDVAATLESVSVDEHHTPALYGTFIKALISARTEGPAAGREDGTTDGVSADIKTDGSAQMPSGLNDASAASANASDANVGMVGNGLFAGGSSSLGGALGNANGGMLGSTFNEYSFAGEMGPVADMSVFPPTMAEMPSMDESAGMLPMDSILTNNFWDNVLVPGYSETMEGLSGGFVFGAGGSGLITPGWLHSPMPSGSPERDGGPLDFGQGMGVALQQQRQ
ncbi:hypothetical protein CONPUDRAFT_116908 [Coniophora puteana RWD-64-598 SS2]|uniref:Zn(2)-C6 fungal-type domain-containing protein n=1 Tax=Coniophora puteana (strain RWD-64-598) TaxID=741705 RepID=A0A5M3N005_CONPW|nr:uncharacterized protein CONPUDRAFT_116908 [Coniophora puteana RWD-64-598 SS2]EIW84743.1 hypothetical protein CONPUDRAFT_116908 [Coniophora puteana RWD-64-598 SS2]